MLISVACLSIIAAGSVGLLNDIAYGPLIAICCVFAMLASGRNGPTTAGSVAAVTERTAWRDHGGGINSVTGWTAAFAAMAVGGMISLLALVFIARAPAP